MLVYTSSGPTLAFQPSSNSHDLALIKIRWLFHGYSHPHSTYLHIYAHRQHWSQNLICGTLNQKLFTAVCIDLATTQQKALESNLICGTKALFTQCTLVVQLGWPAQGYHDACGFCFLLTNFARSMQSAVHSAWLECTLLAHKSTAL